MHCDRVFAILTRGPFPSGEVTDVAVELHLAHCVSCRRLAESLRPIEAAPHETVERGRRARVSPVIVAIIPNGVTIEFDRASVSLRKRWSRFKFHCGASIAEVRPFADRSNDRLRFVGNRCRRRLDHNRQTRGRDDPIPQKLLWPGLGGSHASTELQQQALLLERMELPLVCRKFEGERFLPLSDDPRVPLYLTAPALTFESQCCTQCHSAGSKSHLSKPARNKVIQSCTICHADDSGPH